MIKPNRKLTRAEKKALTEDRYTKTGPFWDSLRKGLEASCAIRDGKTPREVKLEKELEAARARIEVLDGTWCKNNRDEGRGGCGMCGWCCKQAIERAERAEMELVRLKKRVALNVEDTGAVAISLSETTTLIADPVSYVLILDEDAMGRTNER